MLVNLKLNGVSGLQVLLYSNFVIKKRYRVDTIAQKMGISKDLLYRWIRGNKQFPADRLSDLTNATEDYEYFDFILSECGLTTIPKIKDKTTAKMFFQLMKLMESALKGKEE